MTGLIVLWSGAIVDIPNGWVLCDGNNGTPDLRNRFVLGAGSTYNPNDSGGSEFHGHIGDTSESQDSFDGETSEDNDCLADGYDVWDAGGEGNYSNCTYGHYHSYSGSTYGHDHQITADSDRFMPKYFALAYIMKVS